MSDYMDRAVEAAAAIRIETTYPFRTVDLDHRRRIIEAAEPAIAEHARQEMQAELDAARKEARFWEGQSRAAKEYAHRVKVRADEEKRGLA